ncbi:MAG TPA: YDG domain-containing protein, partial [Chitinophagaceae bacterium]|nr:YDG domain-containing protein [Chitinophagaceae bacterium]
VSQSLTVLPKEISFPGALAPSKSYDGNNTAQLTGINLTGIVGSDVVTVSGGGTFASTGAGTGIAVTANLSLGGADAFKYILVQPTGLTADIYQASQAITFNALPNKTYGNAPFQLTATGGGSTSPVTYTSDNPLVATVLGDMVTITGVGIANITASQNGDVNYMAAPDVIQPLTVVKANQSISFAALPGKSLGDPPFALTATATSGLPVSYTSSNNAVASISGNMVTINGIGTCTITASQAGNANYNAAFDVNRTLSVTYPLIAAWDFFGQNSPATFAATTFHSNLNNTGGLTNITRGATAPSSTGSNSFRTTGFKNEGIAVSNTDYFQTTLKAQPGYKISLSSINASMAGTSTYAASPGVSSQFAYSLDGVNFTLIGNPFVTIGSPANSPLIDVTSIPALQNIHSSLTLTIRYYASGQTTTGGWGFNSASAGVNGLAYGGTVVPCTPVSNTSSVTVCANTLPYVWNGQSLTTSGTYSHTAISSGGCDSTEILNLTVNPCSNTVLSVKAFIQAYYLGGGQMSPALANQGISNPPVNACDSIVVELRDTLAPFNVYHSATVILNQDGTLTDTLPNTNGYYYIVLRHRNALQTWSAQPVLISGNTVNYDFTTSAAQAYGSNQIEIATGPSLWALYSGDVVIDENMDLLDLGAIETDISNFGSGYLSTDLNGDGNVDLLDSPVLESNISNFIYSIHP